MGMKVNVDVTLDEIDFRSGLDSPFLYIFSWWMEMKLNNSDRIEFESHVRYSFYILFLFYISFSHLHMLISPLIECHRFKGSV